jgi:hypothetical protein
MKYQNKIFNKFAKILNTDINNIKIAFKTKNKLIKQINRIKNYTKNPLKVLSYMNFM